MTRRRLWWVVLMALTALWIPAFIVYRALVRIGVLGAEKRTMKPS